MIRSLLLLISFTFSSYGFAEAIPDPLSRFLAGFDSMQANFTQILFNESGEELERSEGILYLQQPGKFHWAYQKPYQQQIITNGELLWNFDEELEQIIIQRIEADINRTPAGILLGNTPVDEHFIKVDMGRIEGFDWIKLTPRDLEAQYKDIRLGFDNNGLGMLIITDKLGQTSRIDFKDRRNNTELSPALFNFEIPENVDVIDERKAITAAD